MKNISQICKGVDSRILSIYENADEICSLFELDADADLLSLFESDPDILKIEGRTEYFFEYSCGGSSYLITTASECDEFEMLDKWLAGEFAEVESSWDTFNAAQTAVAFRGGSGYCYSIFTIDTPAA